MADPWYSQSAASHQFNVNTQNSYDLPSLSTRFPNDFASTTRKPSSSQFLCFLNCFFVRIRHEKRRGLNCSVDSAAVSSFVIKSGLGANALNVDRLITQELTNNHSEQFAKIQIQEVWSSIKRKYMLLSATRSPTTESLLAGDIQTIAAEFVL